MKKFVHRGELSYTQKLQLKEYIRLSCIYVGILLGVSAIVATSSIAIFHYTNSSGKGGLENPGFSQLTQEIINKAEENAAAFETVQEEADNLTLSYESYRIKKGDMIGFIADKFGVTQDTIISVNNIRSSRLIQIGQYLKIPSMAGILYTVRNNGETVNSIAEKYKVDSSKCALVNQMNPEDALTAGNTIFVPDASLDWVTRQEINGDLFKKPIHQRYYTSSYYGWRINPFDKTKRTYHSGIDMACKSGTPIYAALPGKVTVAGWSDVYGNYVVVTHHSGYKSLYGHMSQILVTKGQYVDTTTKIGKVGSTGKSTGPHLHFTVFKNGRTVNPANLWN